MIDYNGVFLSFSGESWIKQVKYSIKTRTMLVNNKYELQNVPLKLFVDFALSESKGKFYNKYIKGKDEFLHEYFKR